MEPEARKKYKDQPAVRTHLSATKPGSPGAPISWDHQEKLGTHQDSTKDSVAGLITAVRNAKEALNKKISELISEESR